MPGLPKVRPKCNRGHRQDEDLVLVQDAPGSTQVFQVPRERKERLETYWRGQDPLPHLGTLEDGTSPTPVFLTSTFLGQVDCV